MRRNMKEKGNQKGNQKSSARRFFTYFKGHWELYLMLLPALVVLIIFAYGPMYGVLIAFKSYKVTLGIWKSPWAANHGFYNFIKFFNNFNFAQVLRNTIVLSVYSLLVNIPCAILLALGLNYAKNIRFKKTVQMITYCPYFISTIVLVGILNMILNIRTGAVGRVIYDNFNINLLSSASAFPSLYVWSGVWQGVGFGSIIYCASLAGVDPQLHEAAIIDGASLLQRIWHVDLPAIAPVAVIMLILNMGNILNVGYEKVLAMQNLNNVDASEIIATYSYKVSLASSFPDFSYSTAIGLFQSVVGLALLQIVNKIADKVSGFGFM